MKNNIQIVFPDLGYEEIKIELNASIAPRTIKAILKNLPININMNRWGDELYTDNTGIIVRERMQRLRFLN
jgi:hypothetical protein